MGYIPISVLAAVHQVINRPFGGRPSMRRVPLPGYGQRALHTDWAQGCDGQFRDNIHLYCLMTIKYE